MRDRTRRLLRAAAGAAGRPRPQPETPHEDAALPDGAIHLVSWAGYPNYGDELIAARWIEHLARVEPDRDLVLHVRHPGMVHPLFGGLHPRLHASDLVFRLAQSVSESGRSAVDLVENQGTPHFDLALVDAQGAAAFHLLGGGFINEVWAANTVILDCMRALAATADARLFATGQGLMPYAGASFEGFDHVSVRDAPSAAASGLPRGVDDAFLGAGLHPPTPAIPRPGDTPSALEFVVCVQSDMQDDGAFEANIAYVRRALEEWGAPRDRVRYVEAIPGDDHPGYAALQDLVAEDGFKPFAAIWREGLRLAPDQVWLTTRYHHHLMAALHGARGVALIGRDAYYDVKHEAVCDYGSRWEVVHRGKGGVVPLSRLSAPESMAQHVAAKSREAGQLYPLR